MPRLCAASRTAPARIRSRWQEKPRYEAPLRPRARGRIESRVMRGLDSSSRLTGHQYGIAAPAGALLTILKPRAPRSSSGRKPRYRNPPNSHKLPVGDALQRHILEASPPEGSRLPFSLAAADVFDGAGSCYRGRRVAIDAVAIGRPRISNRTMRVARDSLPLRDAAGPAAATAHSTESSCASRAPPRIALRANDYLSEREVRRATGAPLEARRRQPPRPWTKASSSWSAIARKRARRISRPSVGSKRRYSMPTSAS